MGLPNALSDLTSISFFTSDVPTLMTLMLGLVVGEVSTDFAAVWLTVSSTMGGFSTGFATAWLAGSCWSVTGTCWLAVLVTSLGGCWVTGVAAGEGWAVTASEKTFSFSFSVWAEGLACLGAESLVMSKSF